MTAAGATLVAESTVTDRYQTTMPDPIRRVLKLGKRDRLRYCPAAVSFAALESGRREGVHPGRSDRRCHRTLGALRTFAYWR